MNMDRVRQVTFFLLRVVAGLLFLQAGGMKIFDWFGGIPPQFGGPIRLPETVFTYLNLGPVRDRGVEVSLDHYFDERLSGFVNYSWQDDLEVLDAAADEIPGVRLVLDAALAEADEETVELLERSQEKELELLALNSGKISAYQLEEHGARVGAAVEAKAREGFEIGANWTPEPVPTFLERLKAGTRSRTSAIA